MGRFSIGYDGAWGDEAVAAWEAAGCAYERAVALSESDDEALQQEALRMS